MATTNYAFFDVRGRTITSSLILAITLFMWTLLGWYSVTYGVPESQFAIVFLGLSIVLYCLFQLEDSLAAGRRRRAFGLTGLTVVGAVVTVYSGLEYSAMIDARLGGRTTVHYVLAVVVILLVLYLAYDSFGVVFPLVMLSILAYAYFGEMMPWIFYHAGFSITRILELSVVNISGAYGSVTNVGAVLVAPFLLFAGLIQGFGGFGIMLKTSRYVNRLAETGVAQMAIVMSMLVGSISGSAAANTSISGSFTIPLMKDSGIRSDRAAAIESVASSGGQIVPPVMGIAAFVMADLLAMSIFSIFVAAVVPAVVFYLIVAFGVRYAALGDLRLADEQSEPPVEEGTADVGGEDVTADGDIEDVTADVDVEEIDPEATESLIPIRPNMPSTLFSLQYLIVIVYLLYLLGIERRPVIVAGVYTSVAMLTLSLVFVTVDRVVFGDRGLSLAVLAEYLHCLREGVVKGTRITAEIMIIIASVGIVIDLLLATGFPTILSLVLTDLAGNSLPLLLIFTSITAILLGLGMPTVAAYLIVAIVLAPTLVNFGLPELQVHFFIFYFAILSGITPPIAVTVIVATSVAGSDFLQTCVETLKIALPLFLLPFLFIYHSAIITADASQLPAAFASAALVAAGLLTISYGLNANHVPVVQSSTSRRLLAFKSALVLVGSVFLVATV